MSDEGNQFFGLIDFRELFWKTQFDLHRLHNSDERKRSYALFDLVTTLNHLWEWLLKDKSVSKPLKVECVRVFNPFRLLKPVPEEFRRYYKPLDPFPATNALQELVRSISNRAKHAKGKPRLSTIETRAYVGAGDPRALAGGPVAYLGYHLLVTSNMVETAGGELHDVKVVCEDLRREWSDFLKTTGLIIRG